MAVEKAWIAYNQRSMYHTDLDFAHVSIKDKLHRVALDINALRVDDLL